MVGQCMLSDSLSCRRMTLPGCCRERAMLVRQLNLWPNLFFRSVAVGRVVPAVFVPGLSGGLMTYSHAYRPYQHPFRPLLSPNVCRRPPHMYMERCLGLYQENKVLGNILGP